MRSRPWKPADLAILILFTAAWLLAACVPATASPEAAPTATPPAALTPTYTLPAPEAMPTSPPTSTSTPPSSSTPPASYATLTPDPRLDLVTFAIVESSLSWDPSGEWLAYTTSDGQAWLQARDSQTAIEISGLRADPPARLKTLWSPDGSRLAVYGVWGFDYPQWTGVWLAQVGASGAEQVRALVGPVRPQPPVYQNEGVVYSASWAPDGQSLAYSYLGEAWIYDLQTEMHEQITHLTSQPLRRSGQYEPFDGVQQVAFSPAGAHLALGLTCNCPSPFSGVAVVDLEARETRLIEAGRLTGWSAGGELIIFENVTGDWAADYTFDVYGASPLDGFITNLTRTNPDFDQLLDPWEKHTPAAYQARGLRWLPGEGYLYTTYDYSFPGAPALGFILRRSPQEILLERMGAAEAWYIFPQPLPDGTVAYIEAEPGHPGPVEWTSHIFTIRSIVSAAQTVQAAGWLVTNAVWTPDGSALALVVVDEAGKPENHIEILSVK